LAASGTPNETPPTAAGWPPRTSAIVATGRSSVSPAVSSTAQDDKTSTYEKAISITLALPPDLAAKVALVDAMKDDVGQYRILPRQKGDARPLSGTVTWSYDDIFPSKKK
jgi:hypothetical protein